RRFFRYFDYVPALGRAVTVLADRDESLSGVGFLLPLAEASRSGFMGLYLLLESLTILDAMDVWVTASAKMLLTESFKFWFYGLVCSIICTVWQLAFYPSAVPKVVVKDAVQEAIDEKLTDDGSKPKQPQQKTKQPIKSRDALMSDLVAVGCDILIPGNRLGWIPVSTFTVGSFSIVSSLLHGKRRWLSVQRSAAAAAATAH
ncbi:Cytoplasmic GTPase/eEF2-like protein (ribosomal biogenesis), partial [Ascosphaera pollenicola]